MHITFEENIIMKLLRTFQNRISRFVLLEIILSAILVMLLFLFSFLIV